jgi:long-chain-fatty-acid--[acyl-carrier-protein] ligase
VLADQDQAAHPPLRWLARRLRLIAIPDLGRHGPAAKAAVETALAECAATLAGGGNLVLYPAGQIQRGRLEELAGTTGAARLLQACPGARTVLVCTTGLWGSRFGFGFAGRRPKVAATLLKAPLWLLLNGLFFGPRREVTITLAERQGLPAAAAELNAELERFHNQDAPPARYVPATRWERGGERDLPEPAAPPRPAAAAAALPASSRNHVLDHLRQLSGRPELRETDSLARDLALDSLVRTELLLWLGREFGAPAAASGSADALQTVADVLAAAAGEALAAPAEPAAPPPPAWFAGATDESPLPLPTGATLAAAFLAQAARDPGRAVIWDRASGLLTNRRLLTGVLALRPQLAALPGERLGVMLPASAAADLLVLACWFAGKTPVMVNWTVGAGVMRQALDRLGVATVVTSRQLVSRLTAAGTDLAPLAERCRGLEELAAAIPWPRKLAAAIQARCGWHALRRVPVPETAVVLFTSGSEALPKAVPLTHANLLANLRAMFALLPLRHGDALLGFLPPFHSFGLTVTLAAPLATGLRVAHHPDPNAGAALAALCAACRPTLLLGTPTSLAGIARAAAPGQLASLRYAITGAESCPERVYALLHERAPHATLLEGYGITECSPVVAVNDPASPRPGSIGRVLANLEWLVVDEATLEPLPPGQTGLLLVRGPSIFAGYLNPAAGLATPFVTTQGREWYQTGDLVCADAAGVLTFRGRRKRFVKIGGEMISLPAIEAALEGALPPAAAEGPRLAVLAAPGTLGEGRPELVLFTTLDLDRATANTLLARAGLSPLHNLQRVVRLASLPLLGSGKTDYRALESLATPPPRQFGEKPIPAKAN